MKKAVFEIIKELSLMEGLVKNGSQSSAREALTNILKHVTKKRTC